MTCDELKAAINSEIAQNARIAAIRSRMDAGTADFLDSELYTAITAEITAEQMRRNVLALSDREPAFVGVVRERYTDTFSVFNAVQRILDAVTGIRIRTVQPEFENDRAHKIGHSLNDPTVPESVIERRAYSATENFVRSQHDRCTKANASFRSRAGLDCRITRTGGAKCCDWCASVSGSFTTGNAPDGIWGRHDNCKCSITYETRRGSFQQLSGSGMGWDTVEELPDLPLHFLNGETAGAGVSKLFRLAEEQANKLNIFEKIKSLFSAQTYQAGLAKFAEQLPDIQNRHVAKILRTTLESTEFAQSTDRRSFFRDGKVYLTSSVTPSTIAHELFHRVDARNEVTKSRMLNDCLISDYERLKKLSKDTGQTLENMLYLKYKDAFERPGKLKPEYRGISDIIEGMTNGGTKLGYGHIAFDPKYWETSGALSHEAFAQYGRMYFEENPAVFAMLKEIFPDTTARVDAIIPAIAQFGR